ncbi:hypothetical protein [Stutzerimonas xanthomarina]|uniref:hypothetical protein n=1 Tax=Stutzerimonas xanthomarina TaxID=271420 RepID=UPI003AA9BA32
MAAKKGSTPATKPTSNTESAAVQAAQTAAQATAETAAAPAAETASANPTPEKPAPPKAAQKGSAGWVVATLKTRHCDGGVCKEAGEEMRMTRGTYERLKKYGRVE